jgi:hypothetical protein
MLFSGMNHPLRRFHHAGRVIASGRTLTPPVIDLPRPARARAADHRIPGSGMFVDLFFLGEVSNNYTVFIIAEVE